MFEKLGGKGRRERSLRGKEKEGGKVKFEFPTRAWCVR
jgi:hypothetical protein